MLSGFTVFEEVDEDGSSDLSDEVVFVELELMWCSPWLKVYLGKPEITSQSSCKKVRRPGFIH